MPMQTLAQCFFHTSGLLLYVFVYSYVSRFMTQQKLVKLTKFHCGIVIVWSETKLLRNSSHLSASYF